MAFDDFAGLHGFGMARQERRHFFRIRFMCIGVGLRRNQIVVKSLRSVERKYRQINHCRSPFLAIGQTKQKSQATDLVGRVGNIRIAAPERKAADDRHAAGLEDNGFREARSLAVAIEKTADANAFGMIAAKTGVDSVDSLKTGDEPRRRKFMRTEPTAQIEKCSRNAEKNNANAAQPYQSAAAGQGRWLLFRRRGRITWLPAFHCHWKPTSPGLTF
jgi:hypothetical protein